MYNNFFSLKQAPFSIAPDPRYLFMTQGHREALAHLLYGVNSSGGVVLLTGEIGAGKTTVCRCFLELVPANCNVAYIFNPKLTVTELLKSICDEFRVDCRPGRTTPATVKDYVDALTHYLLATHAEGQNNVLVIDEAQNLSPDVLEQLRLLTNLETNERKLLQITLIGQPELRDMLDRPELKQLAQRVIARYHLKPLSKQETASYIQHRLAVAGLTAAQPFQKRLVKRIHRLTDGVPRRINLLCDRALLGAFAEDKREVDHAIISKAAAEVFGGTRIAPPASGSRRRYEVFGVASLAAVAAIVWASVWAMENGVIAQVFGPGKSASAVDPSVRASAQNALAPEQTAALAASLAPGTSAMPAAPILSEADGSSGIGWTNKDAAYRQLAQMWSVALPQADPCWAAREHNLHCYMSAGGFAELRQLDRPALLTMQDKDKRTYHVLLTGLTDTSATLQVGSVTQTISPVLLARYFHGDFATLWRGPQPYRGFLSQGDQGPEVDWIATQLAKLEGHKPAGPNQVFDENLLQQVREFQLAQGLAADGMVGPITFMHLNRIAGLDEPRLRTAHAAARAATTK